MKLEMVSTKVPHEPGQSHLHLLIITIRHFLMMGSVVQWNIVSLKPLYCSTAPQTPYRDEFLIMSSLYLGGTGNHKGHLFTVLFLHNHTMLVLRHTYHIKASYRSSPSSQTNFTCCEATICRRSQCLIALSQVR